MDYCECEATKVCRKGLGRRRLRTERRPGFFGVQALVAVCIITNAGNNLDNSGVRPEVVDTQHERDCVKLKHTYSAMSAGRNTNVLISSLTHHGWRGHPYPPRQTASGRGHPSHPVSDTVSYESLPRSRSGQRGHPKPRSPPSSHTHRRPVPFCGLPTWIPSCSRAARSDSADCGAPAECRLCSPLTSTTSSSTRELVATALSTQFLGRGGRLLGARGVLLCHLIHLCNGSVDLIRQPKACSSLARAMPLINSRSPWTPLRQCPGSHDCPRVTC